MNQKYDLAPADRADESVRKILLRLFVAMQSNVDGVVEDLDTELLHKLRVANRRTRTALSQTGGVLPSSVTDVFPPEFKWLGEVTGPCRDLDVFLREMGSHRQLSVIDDEALVPLENFLRAQRRLEHSRVSAALRSERFQRLLEGWGQFLDNGSEDETTAPLADAPIIDVASSRIFKAHRRMWKRGTQNGANPPTALLHRLRIDGKKLRYLLEFFSELYPRATVARFIKELIQLQKILGVFNDTVIQLALIKNFVNHGTAPVETLSATKNLTDAIANRQRQLRAEFSERFALFSSEESRELFKKTIKVR